MNPEAEARAWHRRPGILEAGAGREVMAGGAKVLDHGESCREAPPLPPPPGLVLLDWSKGQCSRSGWVKEWGGLDRAL